MRQSGYQDEQTRGSWHGWQQAVEPGWRSGNERSGSEREGAGYGFEEEGRQGSGGDHDRPGFRFNEPRQQYGSDYGQGYGEGVRYGRGRYEGGDADWPEARRFGFRSAGSSGSGSMSGAAGSRHQSFRGVDRKGTSAPMKGSRR